MAPPVGPNTNPVGPSQANDTYSISNDYVYPRYTTPGIFSPADIPTLGSNGVTYAISPYKQMGLLRGWLYPMDMNKEGLEAGVGAASNANARTASDEAMAEAEELRRQAEQATGIARDSVLPALQPVGPSGVLAQSNDAFKVPKQLRYREGKQFQFNPFSVELSIAMIAAAPDATGQQGGTASNQMVGSAETRVELYFDRSIETAAATHGRTTVSGHKIDPVFADIGVQKDLWDVYRIILGGDETYFANVGKKLVNIDQVAGMTIRPGSGTDMFTRLFDLGYSGSQAWTQWIALYYNPNLVIIGEVTSVAFIYAEFNANYVPTKAKMDLGLLVFSTTSESGTDAFNNATDEETDEETDGEDDGDDNSTENASTSTSTNRTVVHTANGARTNTYRVSGTNQRLQI